MRKEKLSRLNAYLDSVSCYNEEAPKKALIISGDKATGKTMFSWLLQREYKNAYRTHIQYAEQNEDSVSLKIANAEVVIFDECSNEDQIRRFDKMRVKYHNKLFVFITQKVSYKNFPEKFFMIIRLDMTDYYNTEKEGATNDDH